MNLELKGLIHLLSEKKVENIRVIDVSRVNPLTHYFVICTVLNSRQGEALAGYIGEYFLKINQPIHHIEGRASDESGWVLVDAGNIIIHLFQHPDRVRFNLEGLWGDQPTFDENAYL